MSFLAMGLIVEMVFFGPIGLLMFDIPVRKTLIGALVLCSIFPMLHKKSSQTWPIWLTLSASAFLAIWGYIVPLSRNVDVNMSIIEIQPFIAILLIIPFYYLFMQYGPGPYLKTIRITTGLMAAIVIFLWATTNVLGMNNVGISARDFYIALNDTDFGIYIGPMPDGSFRITLINFILFPIMIAYYNWEKINLPWSAFYGLATFATGTRAFFGVGALLIVIALLRKKPVLTVPAIIGTIGVAANYMLTHPELRIFDFFSDFTSLSARYVQFFSLMNLFWQNPIFGAGFGANASIIRSIDSPFSYELTYVALLAKLGIIGAIILTVTMLLWIANLMRHSRNSISIAGLVIATLLMTATNPYLINLVGMSIAAFLISLGNWAIKVHDDKLFPIVNPGTGI